MELGKILDAKAVAYVIRNLRQQDREELMATNPLDDLITYGQMLYDHVHDSEYSFVVTRNNVPVTCFGMINPYPGVWNVWLLSTDEFDKISTALTKKIKRDIIPVWLQLGHRFQCVSHENNTLSHKWLEFLGFEREAVLKKYGRDQKDFIMFSITE